MIDDASIVTQKPLRMDGFLYAYYILYYIVMALGSFILYFSVDFGYDAKYGYDGQL